MKYQDMTLEISDAATPTEDDKRFGIFKIRVLMSPAGEMTANDAVTVQYDEKDLQPTVKGEDRHTWRDEVGPVRAVQFYGWQND